MMGSDNKPEEPNCQYGVNHAYSSEGVFLMGVMSDNVGDSAKCRENQNVDFRMAKKSEKVLV